MQRGSVLRLVFSLVLAAGVAALSWVPVPGVPEHAVLRLSWKTVGTRVRIAASDDPSLPAHMRAPGGSWESRLLPYRLTVKVDGQAVLERSVTPGGVHQDRPLSVLEELTLPPGERRLEVTFAPLGEAPPDAVHFDFEGRIEMKPRRVAVVTLDAEGRHLKIMP